MICIPHKDHRSERLLSKAIRTSLGVHLDETWVDLELFLKVPINTSNLRERFLQLSAQLSPFLIVPRIRKFQVAIAAKPNAINVGS